MTLINRSFFPLHVPVQCPTGAGRRSASANDPSSEPAPQNRDGFECGRSVRTNQGWVVPMPTSWFAGRVPRSSTLWLCPQHLHGRPTVAAACHRCWLRHDARQTTEFPPPQATARKANIPLRKRPCCTVVQQQIPFTVAQISQPSAPRHGKVSLPVDDDSNWSNGEPWGA